MDRNVNNEKYTDVFAKTTRIIHPSSLLSSLRRGRKSPPPPTRIAAATHLSAQIGRRSMLRRRVLSVLDGHCVLGRPRRAGFVAAVPADLRRVSTPPAMLRPPKSGGDGACGSARPRMPTTRTLASQHAVVRRRRGRRGRGRVRPPLTSPRRPQGSGLATCFLGWAASWAARLAFFFSFPPIRI